MTEAERRCHEVTAAQEEANQQREVEHHARELPLAKERREKDERHKQKLLERDRLRKETLEKKAQTADMKGNARAQWAEKAQIGRMRKRKRVRRALRASAAEK